VLLAKGAVQDRHEQLDVELLAACEAHDPDRASEALRAHLETAADIYAVELAGRSIFAF
jgi:DNA-binding GntR family transcriptional regulator